MSTLNERFWSKVEKSDGCWNWTASLGSHGAGQFSVNKRPVVVPRYVWEQTSGPIPDGGSIRQSCGNRRCCNPAHLVLHEHCGPINKRPLAERFFEKIKKSAGCWEWRGGSSMGYGHMSDGAGGQIRAHRVSWLIHNGEIPNNLFVCHKCNNKNCVNPDHLYLATCSDNSLDALRDGLMATGERHHGAKLCRANIVEIRTMKRAGKSTREIANHFSISESHAAGIISHKFWKDV